MWTFADKRLLPRQIPTKFIEFNLASAGSIAIQEVVAVVGERTLGLIDLFTIGSFTVDTGMVYAVVGIGFGMIWNYMAYSRVIWKK